MELAGLCILGIGLCARICHTHDERDRLTRQLLGRVNEAHDKCLLKNLWLPERPTLSSRQRREIILLHILSGIHLPSEAYSLEQQAKCLSRCAAKKWVVWNDVSERAGKYRDYTLTVTPRGLEKLIDLRLLLPPSIPGARLHSR
jgi:hypothetical protein